MALSFALITEGVSEHRIIKYILQHYFDEEPDIHQIQPQIVSGKQGEIPGGWNEVLKYCKREEDLNNILQYNDFIVFQIDTDMCEIAPFSVSRSDNGVEKSDEELYDSVRTRLLSDIPDSVDKSRLLFAICINMIECWFLPVFERGKKACATKNCLSRLNDNLRKQDIHIITEKNSDVAQITYDKILGYLKKKKDIISFAVDQWSFNRFIQDLAKIDSNGEG